MQRTSAPTVEFLTTLEQWLRAPKGLQQLKVELEFRVGYDTMETDGDRLKFIVSEEEARAFLRPLLPFLVERATAEREEMSKDLNAADSAIGTAVERVTGNLDAERSEGEVVDADLPF